MDKPTRSPAEERFLARLKESDLPIPEREWKFAAPHRQWRFDFAYPSMKIAVEIEGRGRHTTIAGYAEDCRKYNAAAGLGWTVLRFTSSMTRTAEPVRVLRAVILLRTSSVYDEAEADFTRDVLLSKPRRPRRRR